MVRRALVSDHLVVVLRGQAVAGTLRVVVLVGKQQEQDVHGAGSNGGLLDYIYNLKLNVANFSGLSSNGGRLLSGENTATGMFASQSG